jgi:hypothetical protein
MVSFNNENILKSIFVNITSFILKDILDKVKDRIICEMLLITLNSRNILDSFAKTSIVLNEHVLKVNHLIQLPDGNLVSVSDDKLFKLWNIKTKQ